MGRSFSAEEGIQSFPSSAIFGKLSEIILGNAEAPVTVAPAGSIHTGITAEAEDILDGDNDEA